VSRRCAARVAGPTALTTALALALGGCLPETVTPLSPSDGGTPARDRAVEIDESIHRVDATPDASIDAGSATDAACAADTGRTDGSTGCADRGPADTSGDGPARPN